MLEKLQTTESISEMTKQISENELCRKKEENYVNGALAPFLLSLSFHSQIVMIWVVLCVVLMNRQINNKVNSPSGNVQLSFNVQIQYILKLVHILKLYSRTELKPDSHMNDFIMHNMRYIVC